MEKARSLAIADRLDIHIAFEACLTRYSSSSFELYISPDYEIMRIRYLIISDLLIRDLKSVGFSVQQCHAKQTREFFAYGDDSIIVQSVFRIRSAQFIIMASIEERFQARNIQRDKERTHLYDVLFTRIEF